MSNSSLVSRQPAVKGIYKQSWMDTTGTEENFILTVEVV
jgi:predicted secreted protein